MTGERSLGRILYVEDDSDLRQLFADFLAGEGYDVVAVSTAEDALEELEGRADYQLLLTDYRLPRNNADWLLRAATGRLLDRTAVIILSAELKPLGIAGHRVLRKPVACRVLMDAIAEVLDPESESIEQLVAPASGRGQVSLRLYVSGASPESQRSSRNLARILRGFDPATISLVIHDIALDEGGWLAAAEEDRVIVTPTLVRTHPLPKVWVLGDLSRREPIERMIRAGLDHPIPR